MSAPTPAPPGARAHRVTLDGPAAAGGLTVRCLEWGAAGDGRPPVVLLHGFTGAADGWAALAGALAPQYRVLAPDLVGHGGSDAPAAPDRYRMDRAVDDVVAALAALGVARACWLGYSMGGRTALQVADRHPDRVAALVLEGASPGLATAEERAARVAADEALARRIEERGVPAFVDEWEALPLFATQRALPAETRARVRAGRLANRAAGLAGSLRGMGTGAQRPLHDRLAAITAPVLLVAGARDAKYVAIAGEMARALPDATIETVADAGHAAHLERPAAFAACVREFLQSRYAPAGASGPRGATDAS